MTDMVKNKYSNYFLEILMFCIEQYFWHKNASILSALFLSAAVVTNKKKIKMSDKIVRFLPVSFYINPVMLWCYHLFLVKHNSTDF